MIDMTLVDLSRLQFALTALYHFLFVPLTLGLSMILAIMGQRGPGSVVSGTAAPPPVTVPKRATTTPAPAGTTTPAPATTPATTTPQPPAPPKQ